MSWGSTSQGGMRVLCLQGFKGCSVPALVWTHTWVMLTAMAVLPKLLLSQGSSGWASRDCHESTASCSVHQAVSPTLHPPQHRLLSSGCRASVRDSYRVLWFSAAAPRGSATRDLSRQVQHLSSSVALSRLWVDLIPSEHKNKISQKVFCKLTLGKDEMKTSPACGLANPPHQGQAAVSYPALNLSAYTATEGSWFLPASTGDGVRNAGVGSSADE